MQDNPLKLRQIPHVEFWVGNARQAAYFYRNAFGFSEFAYSGLETGRRDMTAYVMRQGRARFVLATPLVPDHPASDHLKLHGDGVRDIAFQVDDADYGRLKEAVSGATPPSSRTTRATSTGGCAAPPSTPTATRCIPSSPSTTTTGHFCPATSESPCRAATPASSASTTSSATWNWGRWTTGRTGHSQVLGFKRFISFDDKDINTDTPRS
jgi:4-hydroxyphenylpyruvate dioxygenase